MPYTVGEIRSREFLLRLLLVSFPKGGKTTAAVMTSPRPVFVLNTDGQGALDPCVLLGDDDGLERLEDGDMEAEDVLTIGGFKRTVQWIRDHGQHFKTVIFDNISTFGEVLLDQITKEVGNNPRAIYPRFRAELHAALRDLLSLPQHVVVISHAMPGEMNEAASFGHMLSLPGKSSTFVASTMQDWVWLEVTNDEKTKETRREFLLGPEGSWTKAVRSIREGKRMPAHVSMFLDKVKEAQKPQPKKPQPQKPPQRVNGPVARKQ